MEANAELQKVLQAKHDEALRVEDALYLHFHALQDETKRVIRGTARDVELEDELAEMHKKLLDVDRAELVLAVLRMRCSKRREAAAKGGKSRGQRKKK